MSSVAAFRTSVAAFMHMLCLRRSRGAATEMVSEAQRHF